MTDRPYSVATLAERMATAPMPKRWPKGKHFDCRGDGCSKCRVCRYLSFIEWTQTCGKPEGTSIERNTKIEAYLDFTYPSWRK